MVHNILAMSFSKVYPLYVAKAERKNRTKQEVDEIICWLTGYSNIELQKQILSNASFEVFFNSAPLLNPNCHLIKGSVYGIRVENIQDPLIQKVRYLDKLIDGLAKGKSMDKILLKV